MGLFNLNENEDIELTSKPQNDIEIWFRDTYAIWSYINCEGWQYIGGCRRDKQAKKELRYILKRDWRIKNPKKCLAKVADLKDSIEIVKELKPEDYQENQGAKDFVAWDLCRATQVLAIGYVARYFSLETLNKQSAEVGKLMQSFFTSWEDLMENYIIGYSNWANEIFGDSADEKIKERKEAYVFLKQLSNGPYKKPWLTNLTIY